MPGSASGSRRKRWPDMAAPLFESLRAGFEQLPAALLNAHSVGPLRRNAIVGAAFEGLPETRSEAWRYTSLRALENREFVPGGDPEPELDAALVADIAGPRLVFVNGVFAAALSHLHDLPAGVHVSRLGEALTGTDPRAVAILGRRYEGSANVFARLNTALALEGVQLTVEEGVQASTPVHLVFIGAPAAEDRFIALRHLIALRDNAALRVIEHHRCSAANRNLDNQLWHVHLKPGARLDHVRVQTRDPGAVLMHRSDVALAGGSHYRRLDLELGAALSRNEINVALQGEQASLEADGTLLADGKRHLDTRLDVQHSAPNTVSRLGWRGIAAARARVALHGGIHIRAEAAGSDAQLQSRNLLLSEQAEIDARPVLEIDTDAVKAAHGATVGNLDAQALFYLRSRGIPEAAARALLIAAFARAGLGWLAGEALAETLAARIDAAFADDERPA